MSDTLTKKDFESDQDVRWCPACGDYAILSTVQKFLPTLGIPKEQFVFISGIGCAARFPYYMDTYGFHTIHGRAPALATGVKVTNPELSVWLVTGDGDSLSIGGNHLLHLLRRNLNINVLLFNNRIYGLTKGQYSPTSEIGKVTKSTPLGSIDYPVDPLPFALGAEASFVARSVDTDAKHLSSVLAEAASHKGTSFIEIYQNCVVFNADAFDYMAERSVKEEAQLRLQAGELMIFGKERNKGIALSGLSLKVVEFEAGNQQAAEEKGVIRFDKSNRVLAQILARFRHPEFPIPVGVLYQEERACYEEQLRAQEADSKQRRSLQSSPEEVLSSLYRSGETWLVR